MDGESEDNNFDDNVLSDSDESLSLDLDFYCDICEKSFSSFKTFLQHEKSNNHYKKISQKKLEKKLSKHLDDELSNSIDDMTLYSQVFSECDACKKSFSGPESYYQHLISKVHRKKVARNKLLEKVTHEGIVDVEKLKKIYKQNGTSQDTSTEVGASRYSPTVEDTGSDSEDDGLAETHQFECTDCDKVFTGIDPWHQHLVSKTHEKTLKQKKLFAKVTSGSLSKVPEDSKTASLPTAYLDQIEVDGDVLVCRLCHKSFSGPESAEAHLKSKGHANKKELRKFKTQLAAKRSQIKKTKAQDVKNESQVSEGPVVTSHDSGESKPAISNEIIDNDVIKGLGNPMQTKDSEIKGKSVIVKIIAQDVKNVSQVPLDQASNIGQGDLVSTNEIVKDIATDAENQTSGHSNLTENPSRNYENSIDSIVSKDAAVETENLSDARKDNALLSYEKYKNYKKIMNEIEAEKKSLN